jgi:hypothetical protein
LNNQSGNRPGYVVACVVACIALYPEDSSRRTKSGNKKRNKKGINICLSNLELTGKF